MILATLALALQLAVPPGYMPSRGGVVICPGHGAGMAMAMPMTAKAAPMPAKGAVHGARNCWYPSHGVAPTPLAAPVLASAAIETATPLAAPLPDLAPGRGLAAPPPPPRGPPIRL